MGFKETCINEDTFTLLNILFYYWTGLFLPLDPFQFFLALILWCSRSTLESWVHTDWTFRIWIYLSTTSQRCSMGLKSSDLEGHFNIENSYLCSMNQSATIFDFWHGVLSFWMRSLEDEYSVFINWGMCSAAIPVVYGI